MKSMIAIPYNSNTNTRLQCSKNASDSFIYSIMGQGYKKKDFGETDKLFFERELFITQTWSFKSRFNIVYLPLTLFMPSIFLEVFHLHCCWHILTSWTTRHMSCSKSEDEADLFPNPGLRFLHSLYASESCLKWEHPSEGVWRDTRICSSRTSKSSSNDDTTPRQDTKPTRKIRDMTVDDFMIAVGEEEE